MTKQERFLVIQGRKARPDRGIQDILWDVRRKIHFARTLKADVAAYKKRSKAAKAGWAKRKATR